MGEIDSLWYSAFSFGLVGQPPPINFTPIRGGQKARLETLTRTYSLQLVWISYGFVNALGQAAQI